MSGWSRSFTMLPPDEVISNSESVGLRLWNWRSYSAKRGDSSTLPGDAGEAFGRPPAGSLTQSKLLLHFVQNTEIGHIVDRDLTADFSVSPCLVDQQFEPVGGDSSVDT